MSKLMLQDNYLKKTTKMDSTPLKAHRGLKLNNKKMIFKQVRKLDEKN